MEALETYLDDAAEGVQDTCRECAALTQSRWVRWARFAAGLLPPVTFLAIVWLALHPALAPISATANLLTQGGYSLHGTVTIGHLAVLVAAFAVSLLARDKLAAIGWRSS